MPYNLVRISFRRSSTLHRGSYNSSDRLLDFVADSQVLDTKEAILAGGCFWGVEYLFKQRGVLKMEVGYCGGKLEHPTYEQICSGQTGHVEAVRVVYDPNTLSFTELCPVFFRES